MSKTEIPCIHSVDVSLYLHRFVEWDENIEEYSSEYDKTKREPKMELIESMKTAGGIFDPTEEEVAFLWNIEHDPFVKKQIFVALKTLKRVYAQQKLKLEL